MDQFTNKTVLWAAAAGATAAVTYAYLRAPARMARFIEIGDWNCARTAVRERQIAAGIGRFALAALMTPHTVRELDEG